MELYKVYFKVKGDELPWAYYTEATCEQEAIWRWQESVFFMIYECEFVRVEFASSENN